MLTDTPLCVADGVASVFWNRATVAGADDCWLWNAAKAPRGYGLFCTKGERILAHRYSLFLATGELPADKMALHSCDNPRCVNPKHLRWGTQFDNMQDASNRKRIRNMRKTHCVRGHEYTPDNTVIMSHYRGKPRRNCRICKCAIQNRQYHASKNKKESSNAHCG
ncbi:HNH endonuclease [Sphingomonas sp. PP-CE-3G-477]|uniref:HNH endonuclease n=1 Tax=Sphingomonas sp. PP-CE-3G-477 TaxID=2135660 RepID=UPI000D37A2B8|nr:HNH endonuclease [Sphingomonas sp. PP-CE-3G-477]PTQ64481.1 HNH endonuclease [Sphingomonas sp. PP-CE-3G-477]